MILKCLGSSSKGNCYILEAQDEVLIIEMGIPMIEVKKALDWNLSKVVGALCTHRHGDHSKFLPDFIKCGIRVLALKDVFDSKNLRTRCFCKEIEASHGYKIGKFKVFAMNVCHDVPCLGFIIEHPEMGKLVFITDTMMIEYKLPKMNHIMIESNYSDEILEDNIQNGLVLPSMRERLLKSHMEIETTKGVLLANDLSDINEVILLHLSAGNSNAEQFCSEIEKIAGKAVYVAKNGLQLNLSILPY